MIGSGRRSAQAHLPRRHQLEVVPSHVRGFAHAGAAVVEEQQERVVAPSDGSTPVRLGDDCAHIVGFEIRCRSLSGPLRRDRQHPRVLLQVGQIVTHQMLEEAADGGAPAVAVGGRHIGTGSETVDPQAWLADVLARINDHKITDLAALLPWRWAAEIARCKLAA